MTALRFLLLAVASWGELALGCKVYSFQAFAVGQVLTAAQMDQVEANIRDHVHGSDSVSGDVPNTAATQTNQETGTSLVTIVTPGRQQFHPSAAKGWVMAQTDGSAPASYNIASITDTGTGRITVVWATDFSSSSYSVVATINSDPAGTSASTFVAQAWSTGTTGGQVDVSCLRMSDFAGTDPNNYFVAAFGDQA